MLITVAASYLVGSSLPERRLNGFRLFLLSNVLWVVWGLHASAWALIVLQAALVPMNVRGARKVEDAGSDDTQVSRARAATPPTSGD